MGHKVGMTHIVRDVERPGSRLHKKEICEAVTLLETPPIVCVGFVGYIETPNGLRPLTCVFAGHLSDTCKRRFYKNWHQCKKKAFTRYQERWQEVQREGGTPMQAEIERAKKFCTSIRAICHTQVEKCKIKQKKGVLKEIQVNGGSISDKVDFCLNLFEQEIKVSDVFSKDENVDTIGVTKGKGFQGVIARFGVTRLPRKTHRGLRKVACIGSWHPARVGWTVPRSGNAGYFHRTLMNKKIFKVGKSLKEDPHSAMTDHDLTEKSVNVMGGFVRYGVLKEDFLMIRGSIQGVPRRHIMIRKALFPPTNRKGTEEIELKFIDTASNIGHGRFQTSDEKYRYYGGPTSKHQRMMAERKEERAAAKEAEA